MSAYTAFETFSAYTEIDCYIAAGTRVFYFHFCSRLYSYITARIGGKIGLMKVLTYFSADFRVVLLVLLPLLFIFI